MNERYFWLVFSVFPGIGPSKFKTILKEFGNAKDAWKAPIPNLKKILGEKLALEFDKFRNEFSPFEYDKKLKKERVWFLTLQDKDYPKLLSEIPNPPFVLYGKGNPNILNDNSIAIVGARRTSQYGREVTHILTSKLVAAGFTIVSGLATGIDAISHKTAIENNGKTIAVLGCGVDCCVPSENLKLYNQIIENDNMIVSELPLSHPPNKGSFPQRNRIIAGLSSGVLVTEGAEDSGSLITADFAFKFNRKVFAVPGPITSSLSKGPYKLISKGAKLITNSKDILDELGIGLKSRIQSSPASPSEIGQAEFKVTKGETREEQKIIEVLKNEGLSFDEIARKTKINPSKLGSILSTMEIKGVMRDSGGIFEMLLEDF